MDLNQKHIFSMLFFLFPILLFPDCIIPPGNVSGNWQQTNSPFYIGGEIIIPAGETLSIEPGCEIRFQGHYKLIVLGRLLAIGSEDEKIHFTVNDTTGFGNPSYYIGGWHGIRFEETSAVNDSSFIIHCQLDYGKTGGSSNNEDSHGGAIYIWNFSKLRISNCIIKNNKAYYGGGIYCKESNPVVSQNLISNNYAKSGGGLLSALSSPQIISNIFLSNYTEWGSGAINWYDYYEDNELILINNLIAQNITEGSGGGISCTRAFENGQMLNNTICDNHAEIGGGIQFYESSIDIVNSIIYGNTASEEGDQIDLYDDASDPNFYFCDIEGGIDAFSGYGMIEYEGEYENNLDLEPYFSMNLDHPYSLSEDSYCINNGIPDITNLNLPVYDLAGESRIYQGDFPRIDIGAYEFQNEPAFVSFLHFSPIPEYYLLPQNVEITCETPDTDIYYTLDGTEPDQNSIPYTSPIPVSEETTILARAYKDNLTPSFIEGGTYHIGFNYFHGEVSGTWYSQYSPYYVIGDVVIPDGETLQIEPATEIIFMGHFRFDVQGQLLAEGSENELITFTINDNSGFNNIEIPDGGWHGIRFEETPAVNDSSRISYCNIKYGKAVGDDYDSKGGAIFLKDYSKVIISHCLIDSNKAFWSGAGIYCSNSSPVIRENTIRENEAISGSGIFTCENSSPLISENLITYNTTRPVGAGAGICVCEGNAVITKNNINNNSASGGGFAGGGGGIDCYNSSSYIAYNIIEDNIGGFGGGIDVSGNSNTTGNPVICNNIIRNNLGSNAGGLYCSESGLILVNNEINDNYSNYGGGIGIFWDADPLLVNNTIINNTANYGGGICISTNCAPNIYNTIIWGNSSSQVYLRNNETGEAKPNFYYCDIQGGNQNFTYFPNTVFVGEYFNNIDIDPCFLASGIFPNSLRFDSPCINFTKPDTAGLHLPEYDIAMNPRIFSGGITKLDMGAYEFQGESIFTAIPQFSIEPGIYEYNQSLELFCLNSTADIYYTLDGSEPDQNSILYCNPIEVSSNTTIKCKAYQTGLEPSSTLSGDFYIGTVSGGISGIYSSAGSPYNIVDDIHIESGDSLIIEPGVDFLFHGLYKFTIGQNATLLALGTETEKISFQGAANYRWHHMIFDESGSDDILDHCVFTDGKAIDNEYHDEEGGAICICNSSPTISNCTFCNNMADCEGGAIFLFFSNAKLTRNLIYENEAVYGGGIYCYQSDPYIVNNTICKNYAEEDGGGLGVGYNSHPIQINVILWENLANCGNQVHLYTHYSQPDFYFCDIQGGIDAFGFGANVTFEGNYENCLEATPSFIDLNLNNYQLSVNSPCIDSGTPSGWLVPSLPTIIIDDFLGFQHFGSNYDMGCYEWLGTPVNNEELVIRNYELSNFPNPFNPSTEIRFQISDYSQIKKLEISIYNLKGQRVKNFSNLPITQSTNHQIVWDGTNQTNKSVSSGIYFYQLKVNGKVKKSRKMMLIK